MARKRKGCRNLAILGCIGCLGLMVVVLVGCAIILGMAWSEVRNEQFERQELQQTIVLPEPPVLADAPLEAPEEFVPAYREGTVTLDVDSTVVTVRPGRPGETIRIEAEYDTRYYELSERFSEDAESWTYDISFGRVSDSYLKTALRGLLGGRRPEIRVYLPPDVPLGLELQVSQGWADAELGGLWLTSAEIEFLQGGGAVDFSKPLKQPMEFLGIEFTQGGGSVHGVAMASPKRVDVGFSMGGGELDLDGTWLQDAEISIDQRMGGVEVRLPSDAVIRGLGRYDTEITGDEAPDLPVLRFSTSASMGELQIMR
jgi:hypothetical protein